MIRLPKLLVAMITLLLPFLTMAHEDPMEIIARLNELVDAGARDPKVFYDRGVSWRSLNRPVEAAADFKKALELNAGFLVAHYELPRALAAQGLFPEAVDASEKAIEVAREQSPTAEAHCWGVLARVELARGGFLPALSAVAQALKLHPAGDLDWFLAEADALRGLGRETDAIRALKKAFDRTRSIVLRTAWLDAVVEAGQGKEALPIIEAELAVRTPKSSWLIRRARVRLSAGEQSKAREDLRTAIEELDRRIAADHPHVTLLIERGMAWSLLGDQDRAAEDLRLAKTNGASPESLAPAERLIASQASPTLPPAR